MLWRVSFYTNYAPQYVVKSQNRLRYEIINTPGEHAYIQYSEETGQIIGPYIYNYCNFQLNYERDSKSLATIKSVIFHKHERPDAHVM